MILCMQQTFIGGPAVAESSMSHLSLAVISLSDVQEAGHHMLLQRFAAAFVQHSERAHWMLPCCC
jgi:hypothetical protein